jgi:putative ABC transport system permease protein
MMLKIGQTYFYTTSKTISFFTALNVLGLSIGVAGLIFAQLYWNDEQL